MNRRFRLKSSQAIKNVRQAGAAFSTPLVVLVTLPNQTEYNKIAVIANRSIGGAVQRNRAKRMIRAAFAPFNDQLKKGHDLLLIAKARLMEAQIPEINQSIKSLLEKSDLLK